MKKMILSLAIIFYTLIVFSQIDSVSLFNSYIKQKNSVRVVNMTPNEDYLKTLTNIYIPSVEEYENDPIQIKLLHLF
jgi:hypothetical protein